MPTSGDRVRPSPRILLADCDQMFCAVAQLVDPEGAGRAELLVVGGSARSRGVVCSASYPARAHGVRSGMSIAQAARLCPQALFVPVPREACGSKSREVAAVLRDWAPKVEAASIDEFYLDLTGTERVYSGETLEATARRIRADVLERTRLVVSIGGGTNRLIAKLAVERAKPRPGSQGGGVLIVAPGAEEEFLVQLDLAEIPGVGPRLQDRLRRYGLVSVRDALRVEERDFIRWLGPRAGQWLFTRLRGRASSAVEPWGPPKSMSREDTFAEDLARDEDLEKELLRLVTRLGADLRAERLAAGCVTVKIRDHDFRTRQASRTLPAPIDSNRAALAVARELLRALRRRRRVPARLLGVAFTRFAPADGAAQLTLLPDPSRPALESERDRALSRTVDRINQRYGRGVVRPARLAGE